MQTTIKAAAKVNLILDLTAVLENGYHSIYTVMQSVGLYDTVTLKLNDSGKIKLSCSLPYIPTTNKNTAYKAAEYFFEYIGDTVHGADIYIDKLIPVQAGMAGGSADAAAVIKGLNHLFDNRLSEDEMYQLGEKVGADVPFCIAGGTRLCLNKGEVMAKLPDLPECYIVIVKPEQGVSTKAAYANFDAAEWIRHPDNEGFLFAATQQDLKTMCYKASNVFEQVVEVSDRVKIKAIMRNHNAMMAMMTGSGTAVFGIFEKEKDAKKCADALRDKFRYVFETVPVKKSVEVVE
ncbi:MAG: 4-(cytidine 5'-diphospho)-2-C-methyl-D-erythritol kinase [Clostridia bacterium]|nr:4-(cytidine 5'-diphospho)-2-C-methyl-D-erythritol kinase [Clostridia bacterium]